MSQVESLLDGSCRNDVTYLSFFIRASHVNGAIKMLAIYKNCGIIFIGVILLGLCLG